LLFPFQINYSLQVLHVQCMIAVSTFVSTAVAQIPCGVDPASSPQANLCLTRGRAAARPGGTRGGCVSRTAVTHWAWLDMAGYGLRPRPRHPSRLAGGCNGAVALTAGRHHPTTR
jgi:hypothetical protein